MLRKSILEQVEETFSKVPIGTEFTRGEIIDAVHLRYKTNKSSIIPSGYCYNITNKGKQAYQAIDHFYVFECISRNTYKYLGQNYPYTGAVYHKPKGSRKEYLVGFWKNGVFTPSSE